MTNSPDLDSILLESRVFPPPAGFSARARVRDLETYRREHRRSLEDPAGFWGEVASDLHWDERWTQVLDWQPPHARWFVGGRLNLSANCLDRHIGSGGGQRRALLWEGERGETRSFTYRELHGEVCRFANVLHGEGVRPGDRVAIYMPMVPEIAVAMLACARIGAVHSVVFGGFSAEALRDRIWDADARLVVTADGGFRRGGVVPLKAATDEAVRGLDCVRRVIVLRHTGTDVAMETPRDAWWHDLMANAAPDCAPAPLDSEHPLFILYTSGTTGKPKGIVHTTAGYAVGAYLTTRLVFDLRDEDVYWCTADCGWVTGHSYVVYGPLLNGATTLIYEGAPNHPAPDRFWSIVARHRVSVLYTAPTAIRAFVKWGETWPARHDLSSLRLLGTVGEPINPAAWMWYHRVIGGGRCPIVDTWWQTETGSIMITPLPGATPTKPGSATLPFYGVDAEVVDERGEPLNDPARGGYLVIRRPWPSMLRTIHGDDQRYVEQYWSRFSERGYYLSGDGAHKDQEGYFWIMGRIDDVLNVAGHRLGTAEVESALVAHAGVAEAAVVGRSDELKGQAIVAFVTLEGSVEGSDELAAELKEHVKRQIGAIARPEEIRFTPALPKTRSGKIMRRLLKDIAEGRALGDTTTLEDRTVVEDLREG
ncbi:MAG: acetate--CoA ligase [Gemmatimonadetes bacterium]|nr:acetate--CoA ligase [Gemmatimonadota bacterium]